MAGVAKDACAIVNSTLALRQCIKNRNFRETCFAPYRVPPHRRGPSDLPFGPLFCKSLHPLRPIQAALGDIRKKRTLNSTELAHNKFNALFAVHDAKVARAAVQGKKPALLPIKTATAKKAHP